MLTCNFYNLIIDILNHQLIFAGLTQIAMKGFRLCLSLDGERVFHVDAALSFAISILGQPDISLGSP